jgi:hypothetical protein
MVHISQNYPFNFATPREIPLDAIVRIRRQVPMTDITKELTSKILFANSLRNKNLIRVESIEETPKTIDIGYEYVDIQNLEHHPEFW